MLLHVSYLVTVSSRKKIIIEGNCSRLLVVGRFPFDIQYLNISIKKIGPVSKFCNTPRDFILIA